MPKVGRSRSEHLADRRHRVFAGRGRVARPVGQEHAVGLVGEDLLARRRCRQDRHPAAMVGEKAEDVPLDAVVDGDDVTGRMLQPAIALAPLPRGLVPGVALAGGDLLREVHADQSRPGASVGKKPLAVEAAVPPVHDHGVGRSLLPHQRGEGAGIDPGDADDAPRPEPGVETPRRAVAGGLGDVGLEHAPVNSAATTRMKAIAKPWRSPVTIEGSAAGRTTL